MEKIANIVGRDGDIMIERLPFNIPSEGLKRDDYIVTRPTDFYNGAGIYVIKKQEGHRLVRCIEQTDGSIQLFNITDAGATIMNAKDFCKAVDRKVFARILVDENLPTRAISQLNEILLEK